jgi:hypothetical protein
VDEADLGACALGLGDGGLNACRVRDAFRETRLESRLGVEERRASRPGGREHRGHERVHALLLLRRQAQVVLEFQHVERSGIAVLIGDERETSAATRGEHTIELLLCRGQASVGIAPRTRGVPGVLRAHDRSECTEREDNSDCDHWLPHGPSLHVRHTPSVARRLGGTL